MLMRNERLARAADPFRRGEHHADDPRRRPAGVRGDLRTQAGRAAIERFFARYCAAELRARRKVAGTRAMA